MKQSLRHLLKDRSTTMLHLTGLSLGLGVCMLIGLWVSDELSYDRFHAQADRIYRAYWAARFGDNEWKIAQCPVPLAPLLAREFPEVERATQCAQGGMTLKKGPDYVREPKGLQVDEQFAAIFSLEFVAGNPNQVLASPDEIILTESMARRYFGESPALGQTMLRNDGKAFQVSGIVRDWPAQSHLKFDFLTSLKNNASIAQRSNQWSSATVLTYFLLKPGADFTALDAKMKNYVARNLMTGDMAEGSNFTSFPFQRLTDIHLHTDFEAEAGHGNIRYVWVFALIALAILALACINFINLATARALTRSREVGVRKVLGSTRGQLMGKFVGETFLTVMAGVCLALLWVRLALPAFNTLTDKTVSFTTLWTPQAVCWLGGMTLLTTLLAGAAPALFLSSFSPANAMRTQLTRPGRNRVSWRQVLVVAQFSISIALIIGTLVVQSQMHYLQSHSLGFDKEQVLILKRANGLGRQYDAFFEKIRSLNGISEATAAQFLPGKGFDSTIFLPEQPANYQETSLNYNFTDSRFVQTLGLKMKEGRNFNPEIAADSADCLINETCAKRLGWTNPVGKTLTMSGNPPGKVLGVVEDFHFQSLHHEVTPMVIKLGAWPLGFAALRLRQGADVAALVEQVRGVWKEMAPSVPFDYSFLDEDFDKQYAAEMRLSKVFALFSGLAILIACLGLFGLASFMAAQRTKEIGIRKVLGATVLGITGMLAKDFIRLVLLAILIASPLAYYMMNQWLADFSYRLEMQWWMFATAGLAAVLVSLLTLGFQSIKAALANPVKSLKSE
ncbi:MAG: ABC transporter permease [Saprospiraceae bacterium]|nr:ABC transporter permease [Saprospiraceae bacterium]